MASNVLNIYGKGWTFPCKTMYESFRKVGIFKKPYDMIARPFNYSKGMYEVFDIPIINESDNTSHSTTKPKELIKQLIVNSSNEGDLVLDPFLGSGTTLRACRETNRRGIGFEKEAKYEPIIRKRIMADIPSLDRWQE